MTLEIKELKTNISKELEQIQDLFSLENFRIKYLGRQGEITKMIGNLKDLSLEEKKEKGRLLNLIKKEIEEAIENRKSQIANRKFQDSRFDITLPGYKLPVGHLHPITQVQREIEKIFSSMGFEIVQGPEIEDEYHNFDALNISKEHPARDLWDTFWLKSDSNIRMHPNNPNELLLRTHTSPVQIRYMESRQPPLRIIAPGRIFRYEATDASHSHTFEQLEGLMVDRNISVANFKGVIEEFFKRFFGKQTKIRLRPSFYPFVEPGFDLDISCLVCLGGGCSVCSRRGWLELAGAGMVHPNVFKAVNYNPKDWQGFAFGFGLDRLAMMKHKIDDIRLFYSGDLRFLKQF